MKRLNPYLSVTGWQRTAQAVADHPLWHDRISVLVTVVIAICTLGTLATLLFQLHHVDYPVPIHYNSLVGFDATGPWYLTYRIGLFAVVVAVVNIGLALRSFRRSRLGSFLLLLGAATVSLFCWIISAAFAGAMT